MNKMQVEKSFGNLFPQLLDEWCYEKNESISPYEIPRTYRKKVWWKCSNGHCFESLTWNRIQGKGCPYCSNRKVFKGFNDLSTTHPKLALEWDYDKNELKPDEITYGSGMKIHWKCKVGHTWIATPCSRTSSSNCNCPYCGNKKILLGENDLASTHPNLIEEWDYEKNTIKPTEVVSGTEAYVWWKCKYGHSWKAKITNRVHGTNCPECKRYLATSFQEQALFYYLKKVFVDAVNGDWTFGYELDIYIPSISVGIEYDGKKWHKNSSKDYQKNLRCEKDGIRLIRVREYGCAVLPECNCKIVYIENNHDRDVEKAINDVFDYLNVEKPRISIDSDRQKIYEQYLSELEGSSFGSLYPDLMKEWDSKKNGSISPYMIKPKSNKKFWWICNRGHQYESLVITRVTGSGCPICANKKVLSGYNDLATINPNLALLWDREKNLFGPEEILPGSAKEVWWQGKCGHRWKEKVCRVSKAKEPCPYCGNRKVLSGLNDLQTLNPDLVMEWNYEKNDSTPDKVLAGKNARVWWKCRTCNHEWQALIQNRREGERKNTQCPVCAQKRRIEKQKISVLNIDTGEQFSCAQEAADKYGCSKSAIKRACNGTVKKSQGYRWRYVEKDDF